MTVLLISVVALSAGGAAFFFAVGWPLDGALLVTGATFAAQVILVHELRNLGAAR